MAWTKRDKVYALMAVLSTFVIFILVFLESNLKTEILRGSKKFTKFQGRPIFFLTKNDTVSTLTTIRPKHGPNYDVEHGKICQGKWQNNYSTLHDYALKRSKKYFVFKCPPAGWGNRLRALLSAFHLAVMVKRAFIIDCLKPSPLEKYLEPNFIKWNYKINMTGLTMKIRNLRKESFGVPFGNPNLEDHLTHSVEGIHRFNGMFYKELKRNPKYNLPRWEQDYLLLGCSFYFLFKKSEYLKRNIEQARQHLGFNENIVIGIHIRRGDISFHHNQGDVRFAKIEDADDIFVCAQKIEMRIQKVYNSSKVIWFLATDSVEVKKYAKKRYPNKVKQLHGPIEHVGHPRRGNEDAGHLSMFLDYFLLQQSDFRIYAGASTFSFSISIITLGNQNATYMSMKKEKRNLCALPQSLKN